MNFFLHDLMLSVGTAEVLEQVLESESRYSDDGNDSDNDSVFQPSDASDLSDDDDDNDDDDDDRWEAEVKSNGRSKIYIILLTVSQVHVLCFIK